MRESEQAIYDQIDRQLGRPATTHMTIKNAYAYSGSTAKDLAANDGYILFGAGTNRQTVWDMEALEASSGIFPEDCMWRTPYAKASNTGPVKFILDLVDGETGIYSDVMQSLAPLVMSKKPDGVIWWTGDNTNGKLAITRALNEIFQGQLCSLSVKQLNGGRSNTPLLNGAIGNIAEDSGQVINTDIYKNIGSHQDFNMHKYHSQKGIEIRGNVHHIFIASNAPRFLSRGWSIDRRTHVVQFNDKKQTQRLPDNQLGQLVAEMCKYAAIIRRQGYRYEWSGITPA